MLTFEELANRKADYIGGTVATVESYGVGYVGKIKDLSLRDEGQYFFVETEDNQVFFAEPTEYDNYVAYSVPYIGGVYLHKPGQYSHHIDEALSRVERLNSNTRK
jgi:hypothetical protein